METTRKLVPFTVPGGVCEGGIATDCRNEAAYWLVAPLSYVVPLQLCRDHASAERTYFGTAMPPLPSVVA